MRKRVIFLVLIIMLVSIASAETKLSMELWNRWTYKIVDGADDASTNGFSFNRGYFRLEPVFSGNIKGRFNLDFFSREDSEVEIGEETDSISNEGAGLKIKYAYLDFSNYLWKDATFTFGLMKTYFGTIYSSEYETIDKDPADKYKFSASTDYGFGISGYLPQGFGTYNVAVYNGEGYKKTGGNIDTNMAYLLNLRIVPVVGLEVGGSYVMDKVYNEDADDDKEINKMAGVARFTMLPNLDLRAQYLTRTEKLGDSEKTVNAISIMPMINLADLTNIDMELVLRYDMYDDDADLDDDVEGSGAYDTMIAGVNYFMMRDSKNAPKLWVQANYSMKNYKYEEKDDESEMLVQLRWKFSGVID
ncbi:MAG: OprO/OprP family phosphate-selective porin [Candidatus Cloacimonetes bacterium]|nr:OprO/OprP family phosphate-selective porin [Candidatus Cloacimonadota bacterium]